MKNAFREKIKKKTIIETWHKEFKEIIDVAVSARFNEEIFENKISELYKTTLEEKAVSLPR